MKDDPGQYALFDGIEIRERQIKKYKVIGRCDRCDMKRELVHGSKKRGLCQQCFNAYDSAIKERRGVRETD